MQLTVRQKSSFLIKPVICMYVSNNVIRNVTFICISRYMNYVFRFTFSFTYQFYFSISKHCTSAVEVVFVAMLLSLLLCQQWNWSQRTSVFAMSWINNYNWFNIRDFIANRCTRLNKDIKEEWNTVKMSKSSTHTSSKTNVRTNTHTKCTSVKSSCKCNKLNCMPHITSYLQLLLMHCKHVSIGLILLPSIFNAQHSSFKSHCRSTLAHPLG